MIPRTTLEQWAVLDAVITHGSFSLAAEALNKSQSAISYAMKTLQTQLPVDVLEIRGRKAFLTNAGEVLLRRAKRLLEQANNLEDVAKSLAQDWEAQITIAFDVIFPHQQFFQAIEEFEPISNGCQIKIIETTLSATEEALLNGSVDLAITGYVPPSFSGTSLMPIDFIALSSPSHTLQQQIEPISEQQLKQHRQIVVGDGGAKRNQDAGWLGAEQRWTVSNFSSSIAMLERGLGFAWMPSHFATQAIKQGHLKRLNLAVGATRTVNCSLVFTNHECAGPATKKLAEILHRICKQKLQK